MSNEKITLVNGKKRRNRIEVFAIKDNCLLAHSGGVNSYIELPGGGLNEDESLLEGGLRELAEEAGWIIANPRMLSYVSPIFVESENSWLMQRGYDEEITNYVICDAIEFKPTEVYESEGDAHSYILQHVEKVKSETLHDSTNSVDRRGRFLAACRLEVIDMVFGKSNTIANECLPGWWRW